MNDAQKALLDHFREIIEETPKSGAVNAAKRPLYVSGFAQAVERRAQDGDELVKYARAKVHEAATASYSALLDAGRPDLTVEAVVADADAKWASEFGEADRTAATGRLGTMVKAHRERQEAAEADAVEQDRRIVAQVGASRLAKGAPLTPDQEATMLKNLATRRAGKG